MEKISQQIMAEVARVIREEATDPRLALVSLTRVDVAPDLSNAVVYWSVMDKDEKEDLLRVAEGLERAASFIRRRVARDLPLKRMPELRFRHDPSLSLGSDMLSLLRSISDDPSA
jgi:ribosome-binding factor A